MNRNSQRGVALVITLIMLAMVTVMAILFIGVSRRERTSVTVSANLADAKLAADSGQARALAEVIAPITAQSNLFAYSFLVSTNFNNLNGIKAGAASLTNVSYYSTSGQLLNGNSLNQFLTNLFYDPRPPVFVVTNITNGASDFRFYLDLNRNGRFDTNGVQRVFDTNGFATPVTNSFVGDPEWIGILEHPDWPHSPTNRFIGRYAFVVVPAGKTLDINYVHNGANSSTTFSRNQGFGSWEINLAAFFRELNTNAWSPPSYSYNPLNSLVGGYAFTHARNILNYRYQNNWASLKSVNQAFGAPIGNVFRNDQIDEYSDGPLMLGIKPPVEAALNADNPARPWSGSYNTNGYSSIQELFDPTKTSPDFVSRLRAALATPGTYNQNTFYRLMSQLGTDSLPANRNQLNLNYANVDATGAINPDLATNFIPWTNAVSFFTNAADRMLRSQSAGTLAVSKIPVYPTNLYSASVHRLLQLAANIYDTTTNRFLLSTGTNTVYAPSVFKPLFGRQGTNIFISGFEEVTGTNVLREPWIDLHGPTPYTQLTDNNLTNHVNVYGIPYVIGAKKGLPNFNEFLLQSSVQVTRRLQATKKDRAATPTFQQVYLIGVSNYFALEAWNSYTQACPFAMEMILTNRASLLLSNANNPVGPLAATNIVTPVTANLPAYTSWQGREFKVPLSHVEILVPDDEYHYFQRPPLRPVQNSVSFDPPGVFVVPDWKLYVTNRVVFVLIAKDVSNTSRIVDVVNFDGMPGNIDISRWLAGTNNASIGGAGGDRSGMFWRTNRVGSAPNNLAAPPNSTWGITNQIWVCLTNALTPEQWKNYNNDPSGKSMEDGIDGFRAFVGNLPPIFHTNGNYSPPPSGPIMQVPFTPTRKLDLQMSWQVNDPLVHYTLEDLFDPFYTDTNAVQTLQPRESPQPRSTIRQLNERYQPWGGKPGSTAPANAYDVAIKDPLIARSDDWDFPTNKFTKFPNIGWLGRVHRGTPWQTVYLKSAIEPAQTWTKWAGRADTHPTNDWHLVGLFTTAPNDNAARGLLSVNQTNAAAWSAVLSGVLVLTNAPPGASTLYTNLFVEPASWQIYNIVANINATRLQMPNQAFPDLGSVLASRALTVASPYLNPAPPGGQKYPLISDEMYERIPQQILSLLKADEPYVVIYAFGQSLRPAENSVVKAPGPYRGLCTNYEITGEVVTKTAVRIEGLDQQPGKPKLYRAVVESYNVLPTD